jgi:hypothetical protein
VVTVLVLVLFIASTVTTQPGTFRLARIIFFYCFHFLLPFLMLHPARHHLA